MLKAFEVFATFKLYQCSKSKDQYHWFPIILTVITGSNVSPKAYNNAKEGNPIQINTTIGNIVHHTSKLVW